MTVSVSVAATIPADQESLLIAEAKSKKSSVSAIIRELIRAHLEAERGKK